MITLTVYFHGPASHWDDRIADGEIIAQVSLPWLWLARFKARSMMADLNRDRCGYLIQRDDEVIEHHKAANQVLL